MCPRDIVCTTQSAFQSLQAVLRFSESSPLFFNFTIVAFVSHKLDCSSGSSRWCYETGADENKKKKDTRHVLYWNRFFKVTLPTASISGDTDHCWSVRRWSPSARCNRNRSNCRFGWDRRSPRRVGDHVSSYQAGPDSIAFESHTHGEHVLLSEYSKVRRRSRKTHLKTGMLPSTHFHTFSSSLSVRPSQKKPLPVTAFFTNT